MKCCRHPIAAVVVLCVALAPWSSSEAQPDSPLFSGHEPISMTLEAPVRRLVNRRDRRETDALVRYTTADGTLVALEAEIRTRGNSRLELCSFPPLSLKFKRKRVRDTLFAEQKRLKLVTLCRPNTAFEQYLELEYLAYRVYATVSDYAFRVRPVRMQYVDTARNGRVTEAPAFFIENIRGVAERTDRVRARRRSVAAEELEPASLAVLSLFQFMIGNTDWSALAAAEGEACCHNTALLADRDRADGVVAVPYDFDQAGLVNASYARPPQGLGLRSVKQRLYRGLCSTNDELDAAIAVFNAARPAIESLVDEAALDESGRMRALDYLAGAYEIFNDPVRRDEQIIARCRG